MKKSLLILFIAVLSAIPAKVYSQTYICGFDALQALEYQKDSFGFIQQQKSHVTNINYYRQLHPGPNYLGTPTPPAGMGDFLTVDECSKAKYLIPIVVHVIYSNTNSATNITDGQIEAQIDKLNYYFRNGFGVKLPGVNTGIQFCLAKKDDNGGNISGILRVASDSATQNSYAQFNDLTSLSFVSSRRVINIYVVENILSSGSTKITGYATMPMASSVEKNNVIVMCYDWFGDYTVTGSPLNSGSLGATLAHEVGHYLGLYHPFNEGCSGINDYDCKTKGDLCCDVPAVSTTNYSCSKTNTCTETYNGNPDDQKENLMDYSDQSCRTMFTADQTDIMHSILDQIRPNLSSVHNINSANLACCQLRADFEGLDIICQGDSAQFTSIKFKDSSTYIWKFYLNNTLKITKTFTNSNINNVWVTLPDTGRYDIELIAVVDSLRDSIYKKQYTYVRQCGPSIASANGNWYFGKWAGIKFAPTGPYRDLGPYLSGPPTFKQINTEEGSISQSNRHGEMLFYGGTDNSDSLHFRIYDKNYKQMKGSPIIGDYTAGMGAVVVPFNNDTNKYYIFHLIGRDNQNKKSWSPPQNYVRYSIVDLSLTSTTKGEVSQKNLFLKDSLNHRVKTLSEAIIMIKRPGTSDGYWVLFEGIDSSTSNHYFYEYIVNASGINYYKKQTSLHAGLYADEIMKASPDGNFILLGQYVYRFDRSNGNISPWCVIGDDNYYGYSFSPDSKKVYTTGQNVDLQKNFLERYNLYADSSKKRVPEYYREVEGANAIQIGPDNKLYIAAKSHPYISRITNPDVDNPDLVNFQEVGVTLGANKVGGISNLGLPNLNDAISPDTTSEILIRQSHCFNFDFIPKGRVSENYKWYFGDGDSSNSKYPHHTYADTGNFTVTLITDFDTITTIVTSGIGTKKAEILGDLSFCDSTVFYDYSPPFYNSITHEFKWKVTNAKSYYKTGNILHSNWNKQGTILLTITDLQTGCKDSTLVTVNPGVIPYNNIIPGTFVICDSSNTASIVGTTPEGAGTGFTYRWYYFNKVTKSWQSIDSATRKDFNPRKIPYNTTLRREVHQSGCRNFSNILTLTILKTTNKINLYQNACSKGERFKISGDSTYGILYGDINWQYSANGTTWYDYNLSTQNIDTIIQQDSIYIRRMVDYPSYCEFSSNIIKIVADISIITQPKPQNVCSFGQFMFTIKVKNPRNLPLTYWWRHKDSTTGTWKLHIGSDTIRDYAVYTTSTDSFQFIIQTPCGNNLFSNKVLLKVKKSGPEIDIDPYDVGVDENDTAIFVAGVFNPYETGLSYQWQQRKDMTSYNNAIDHGWAYKAPSWEYIPNSNNDTLKIVNVGICYDSMEYRMVANNGCNSYSQNARLFLDNKLSDLWMRDSENDTGAEPNQFVSSKSNPSQRTLDIFKSPDLYNCISGAVCSKPQNAEYKYYGNNYVMYAIRNKGIITSEPARLYLYWTFASTGEQWDRHWKTHSDVQWPKPFTSPIQWRSGFNQFTNLDTASPFYNNTYPYGAQINSTGILIPALDSGGTILSSYPWTPPNPAWYYTTVNGKFVYHKKLNICLLARIEYCDEYPHEMKYNELYRTTVDTNVINNNNIVTHNLYVSDNDLSDVPHKRPVIWTGVNQPRENPAPISLRFDVLNPNYLIGARVIATLDDSLWTAWNNGGMLGYGFTPLDSQQLEITAETFVLENIYSDSLFVGNIGFQFLPIDTNNIPIDTSLFTLSQINEESGSYEGGTIFQIDFNILEDESGGGDGLVAEIKKSSDLNKKHGGYMVYPNPANTRLTIYISDIPNTNHTIQITAPTGKILLTETCNLKQNESMSKQIDISHLAVGTYFVRISSDNITEVKRINILR